MNWTSLSDFVEMGGYGPYVWCSYLMAAGALGWEAWLLLQRRRRALDEIGLQAIVDDGYAAAGKH